MPLTPNEIVRKEFREAFRGYNQADVDLFLDDVVEEFTRLYEENQKMKVRLAALQQELARLREGRGGYQAPTRPGRTTEQIAAALGGASTESELRSLLQRFFAEQLKAVESGAPLSATAQRIARDLVEREAARATRSPERQQAAAAPPLPPEEPQHAPPEADPERRPFWAGE